MGVALAFAVLIWPDPWPLVKWGGLVVGLCLIVWGLIGVAKDKSQEALKPKWLPMWSVRFELRDVWPFRRIIPFEQATRIAYEKTRETLYAKAAERMCPDDIRGYYATALWDGVTELYGQRLPSTNLEIIPDEETGKCQFIDGGAAMKRHGENTILYDKLYFKKSDLYRRIKELKKMG